jgi:hypothetical protein
MKAKNAELDAGKPSREPTEPERTALRRYFDRKAAQTAPRMKVMKDGAATNIAPDHPDKVVGHVLLAQTLGTADADFINGLVGQLANAGFKGKQIDEAELR